ncbi:MAG: hypothetical protein ABFD18_06000 [Syntrophomonas sp.]
MAKYSTYIDLSPHYESVVDLESEERNPDLWQEYIVHDDMKIAVEKICQSIKEETKDARRSFWIHGAYGTGKSYAAIVLKHLFEDSVKNITAFMSRKNLLIPYRNQFVAIREKGDFLVVWKTGCTGIKTGIHLMMEMEMAIREKLHQKYGDEAYYGNKSLIASVKDIINDSSFNWENIFIDPAFGLSDLYASFDELRADIMENDLKAIDRVAKIIMEKGWGLFKTVDQFQDWIKEIIAGNHLSETGIVFIWDEFTGFLRDCGDDNVLQRLSEYCKQQPFFMCLIVHRDPSWVDTMGTETYQRILHRYHELEFHITESAAYELIGDSILVRPGFGDQWDNIKKQLMNSISKNITDFDNLEMANKQDRLARMCPLHPMTLTLLTIVAQNFGASERTLFRFMKDPAGATQQVGFIYYINNYGPDDWRWLTPDFLWDYFFTRESDVKDFSTEARRCYQHYINKKELVDSDETALHIFKAAILLMAVMSTTKTMHLHSIANGGRVSATKRYLYLCFAGQLTEDDVDKYLEIFEENGTIRLDRRPNGDARLELPYSGNVDKFDIHFEQIKKKYTRYEVFKKDGVFAKALEEIMWDSTDATYRRMRIVTCSAETNSLKARSAELRAELMKHTYKIGVLVVVPSETNQYTSIQNKLKEIALEDDTQRMIVCVVKEALTDDALGRWHQAITHKELAAEEGKPGSADQYDTEAATIAGGWASSATGSQMVAFFRDTVFAPLFGSDDLARRVKEKVIFSLFPAAPERIVTTNTAYKAAQEGAATTGITLTATNTQMNNILVGLKTAQVFDAKTIVELEKCDATNGSKAVAQLAKFVNKKLSQGAKVKLDQMWQELQRPPFGYYDCLACAGILGFVLRFYVNGQFNWIDNVNNTNLLTVKNMATMITNMCKDKVINNTLSSGSEIWQRYRDYAKSIFKLNDQEASSEEQARKFMREKIIKAGVPFWALKYLEADKFGGVESKDIACKIIDNFSVFISQPDSAEEAMDNVINLFTGRGQLRKTITDAFANAPERYGAFKRFVIEACPQIDNLMDKTGISSSDLFDHIKEMMQQATYTWLEDQVKEKLNELRCEYELIFILNEALSVSRKNLFALQQDLKNCFDNMKVPGRIIEKLDKPWIGALKILFDVSNDGFTGQSMEDRISELEILNQYAKDAWQYVNSSKLLLNEYMIQKGIECSEKELDSIFGNLKPSAYDSPEVLFTNALHTQIAKIAYARNKGELQEAWEKCSGTESISAWCKKYTTPIQWVIPTADWPHFQILKSIQESQLVESTQLNNALAFFKQGKLSYLQDAVHIQKCFLAQIGEEYQDDFSANNEILLSKIRYKCGIDVYKWEYRAHDISVIIKDFVKEKMKVQHLQASLDKVKTMNESALRKKVGMLLTENPDLCGFFISEEE